MSKDWSRFLTALEAKGVGFAQIQFASDRQTVIRATGFTDPLSVAIIETEWQKRAPATTTSTAGGNGTVGSSSSSSGAVVVGGGGGERGVSPQLRACSPHSEVSVAGAGNGNDMSTAGGIPPLTHSSLLPTLPEEVQDTIVASQVLVAALGFGTALLPRADGGFAVSPHVPLSMRHLCQTVLPVADAFVAVRRVEEAEYLGHSLVGMALGEVVSEITASYAHQITKLQRWCGERAMPLMGVVSEIIRVGHHIVRLRQMLPMDLCAVGSGGGGSSSSGYIGGAAAAAAGGKGGLRGPRILNHLSDQAERCAGSREDSELVGLLLRRALVPYLRLLHRWMHEGILEDPFGEFFITEAYEPLRPAPTALANARRENANHLFPQASPLLNSGVVAWDVDGRGASGGGGVVGGVTREQLLAQQQQDVLSFERRFSMNKLLIPSFLEKPGRVAKMIFFAGKYSCLLREYNDICPAFGEAAEGMLVWSGPDALHRRVQESFDITSQAVMQLLFSSSVDLVGHLQSLKKYFLHERGDWVADFLDSAEDLLDKPVDKVRAHPIRVLLQAAIARSCGAADPYHAQVGCSFAEHGLLEQLRRASEKKSPSQRAPGGGCDHDDMQQEHLPQCLEMLQLDVEVQWPLSLVLDARVVQRLNVIFRLLTWVKACERSLSSLWYRNEVLGSFSVAYSIKHQLTHFLRQFQFYAGHFVLEPLWGKLMTRVAEADSVFVVNNALNDFFDSVEMGLVLASPHRFRSLANLLTLSSRFTEVGMYSSATTMPLIEATLQSLEDEVLQALADLASPVGADYPQLVPLLTWIDFSGFYDRNRVYHVQRGSSAA